MYKISYLFFILLALSASAQQVYKKQANLMGVHFEFAVVSRDSAEADNLLSLAVRETQKIEDSISSWKSTSQTGKINTNAGIKPVKVSIELYRLIERSKQISQLTHGYFDISFASIDKFWDFNKKYQKMPDSALVSASVKKINYKNIILNPKDTTVYLKEKGMKIGFGAIGKGYVAEYIKALWKSKGVKAGLINASGDLTCFGEHPQNKSWKIAIKNPHKNASPIAWFDLENSSVVTSGSYEKYVEINGNKYTHIINPQTGWPVQGLSSVTIFCANAELADALATSVFVMGKDKGLEFINQLNGVEALLVDNKGKVYYSDKLKINQNVHE